MRKIVHILYSGLGGASDVCSILSKIDKKMNLKSSFIQVGPNQFSKNLFNNKQTVHFIKTRKLLTQLYFLSILKKIITEKPCLIFLHNYSILPIFIYKIFYSKNLKVVYVDHNPNTLKNYKDYVVCKFFRSIIDFFIVLNFESYNYFVNTIKINRSCIKKIPNAVNQKFISKTNKKKNKKKVIIFGMASRINKLKRHDLIINAIQDERLKNFNIKCYFAGNGENTNYLKSKITDKKKFKFFGALKLKRLKKWYNSIDIYIQASKGEGHSTSVLQAMGMNLPVLASNVSGIKNFLIPKKKIGILFENNENSLIRSIKKLLQMKSKQINKIISSQKKYIFDNYSETKFLEDYSKIIKKLINVE